MSAFETSSYQSYLHTPSAVLSDGIVPVPLWSVTQMTIEETYSLPTIGGTSRKAAVASHDDMLSAAAAAPAPASKPHIEPANEQTFTSEPAPPAIARPAPVAVAAPAPAVVAEAIAASRNQAQLLAAVKNAIEESRLDIYLQPMVTLPQRKVRFYEAVTRLRRDGKRLAITGLKGYSSTSAATNNDAAVFFLPLE